MYNLTVPVISSLIFSEPASDGKIKFKKPVKRSAEETELNTSTKKKKEQKDETKKEDKEKKDRKEKKKSGKGVKNSTLLSFNEDEEDAT